MRRLCVLTSVLVGCPADPAATTDDATGATSGAGGTGGSGAATGGESTSGSDTGATDEPTGSASAVTSEASATGGSSTGEPAGGGCGKDPGQRGSAQQTVEVAGVERTYILSLPADYDPDTAYPLVFAWHGRGGDGSLAKLYFKVEEASQGQAIFVYPYGLPLADMQDQTGWDLDPNNEDFEFFDRMFVDLSERLCVDPSRVFSTGHSFGGYMSNQVGCFRGDIVRAIGLVAGGGPYVPPCAGQVAAWLAHGTVDMVVPYSEGTDSRDYWSSANHCAGPGEPVDPAPCVAYTGCDAGYPVVWCSHDEPDFMGHGWPNWAGAGIWGFFAQF